MRPKELSIILLAVLSFSCWQKGYAQEYYDLYTNNVFYREKKKDIQREAVIDHTSSGPPRTESYLEVKTVNHESLIGHPVSPTPMRVPTVVALVSTLAVVLIIIVLWLIHLVRKRQGMLLRKEFTMTTEDAQLSSMALRNDPYKSVFRNDSYESFRIPMPDEPRQTSRTVLAPQISLTSSAGRTTHLHP